MKIRSKALYLFLLEEGVLDGSQEEIAQAKQEFRKQYQKNWKRNKPKLKKEIRFELTHKEYFELKVRSLESGLFPTTFAKDAVLTSVAKQLAIPNKATLDKVLQVIGIAASLCQNKDRYGNISGKQVEEYLFQAEGLLLDYLNHI